MLDEDRRALDAVGVLGLDALVDAQTVLQKSHLPRGGRCARCATVLRAAAIETSGPGRAIALGEGRGSTGSKILAGRRPRQEEGAPAVRELAALTPSPEDRRGRFRLARAARGGDGRWPLAAALADVLGRVRFHEPRRRRLPGLRAREGHDRRLAPKAKRRRSCATPRRSRRAAE
jgi:hypothetical protein